jgi:hypothetical protein
MHGICFDYPLQDWFEHKVPKTKVDPGHIEQALIKDDSFIIKPDAKIVWLGTSPESSSQTKSKKGRQWEVIELKFYDKKGVFSLQTAKEQAEWLIQFLQKISPDAKQFINFREAKEDYERLIGEDFEPFWYGKVINTLRQNGLLVL